MERRGAGEYIHGAGKKIFIYLSFLVMSLTISVAQGQKQSCLVICLASSQLKDLSLCVLMIHLVGPMSEIS